MVVCVWGPLGRRAHPGRPAGCATSCRLVAAAALVERCQRAWHGWPGGGRGRGHQKSRSLASLPATADRRATEQKKDKGRWRALRYDAAPTCPSASQRARWLLSKTRDVTDAMQRGRRAASLAAHPHRHLHLHLHLHLPWSQVSNSSSSATADSGQRTAAIGHWPSSLASHRCDALGCTDCTALLGASPGVVAC